MYISCGCMEVGALKEVWYSNLPDIKGTAAKNTKLYTVSSLGLQLNAHIKTRHSCPGLKESTICDLFLFSPKVLHINTVTLNTGPIYTAIQKSMQPVYKHKILFTPVAGHSTSVFSIWCFLYYGCSYPLFYSHHPVCLHILRTLCGAKCILSVCNVAQL